MCNGLMGYLGDVGDDLIEVAVLEEGCLVCKLNVHLGNDESGVHWMCSGGLKIVGEDRNGQCGGGRGLSWLAI